MKSTKTVLSKSITELWEEITKLSCYDRVPTEAESIIIKRDLEELVKASILFSTPPDNATIKRSIEAIEKVLSEKIWDEEWEKEWEKELEKELE